MGGFHSYLVVAVLAVLSSMPSYAQLSGCTVEGFASNYDVLCGDTISLSAIGNGDVIFEEDFDDFDLSEWEVDPTGTIETNLCQPTPEGTPYLWFGSGAQAPRDAVTPCLNTSTGGVITFRMRFARQGGPQDCEGPDLDDEGVHLQYRLNPGCGNPGPWTQIDYWGPKGGTDPERTSWTEYVADIPEGGEANSVQIRWAQLVSSAPDAVTGDQFDNWGIEDVRIVVNPPDAIYTWEHTGNPRPTGATPKVVPTSDTDYIIEYTDGSNFCYDTVSVTVRRQSLDVTVNPTPPLCPGETVTMTATSEIELPNYNCEATTECIGSATSISIGNGNILNENYRPLGFNNGGSCTNLNGFYNGTFASAARTQFIIRKDEIPAFLNGGQLYSIQLNAENNSSHPNFRIKMGCTDKTEFTSDAESEFQTGLIEVHTPKTVDFGAGWNTIEFDQNYEWDGNSNIVIEVCWNASNPRSNRLRKTNTGFASAIHTNTCFGDDFNCGYLGATAAIDNNRPTMRLELCYRLDPQLEYTWTPTTNLSDPNNNQTDANPTETTTYTVEVRDNNAPPQCAVTQEVEIGILSLDGFEPSFEEPWCEGQDLQLYANISGATYSWTGPNGFFSGAENPVIANAGPEAAGEYTLFASNGNCDGEATVTVVATEPGSAGTPRDTALCNSSPSLNLNLMLSDETPGGSWVNQSTGDTLSGNSFDPGSLDFSTLPATIPFEYVLDDPCGIQSATLNLTVNPGVNAGGDNNDNICESLGSLDLSTLLTNDAQPDGTWEDPDGTGQLSGSLLNTADLGFGEYVFWYIVTAEAPCENDTAFIDLTIQNQPYAGQDGEGSVCIGNTVNLFNLLTDNPENGGTWVDVNGSGGVITGNTYDATNATQGTYTLQYVLSATAPCANSEAEVTLTVAGTPEISNVLVECNEAGTDYIVTFDVEGGDPASYTANIPGTFGGGQFTSNPIPSGQETTIEISDANGCGTATTTVNKLCDCKTQASEMFTDTLVTACEGEAVNGVNLGGFFSDGNDVEAFYLHTNLGPTLGTVLAVNPTDTFNFIPGTTDYDVTYYISAVAGNDDGNGLPDLNDPCLSVSPGTPVIFYQNAVADLSLDPAIICPGEDANLTVTITHGVPPFDVVIGNNQDATEITLTGVGRTASTTVSRIDTTTFTVLQITDAAGCTGLAGNPATLAVNEAPVAKLEDGTSCGAANGLLNISVSGAGTAWEVVYTNDFDGSETTLDLDETGYSQAPPAIGDGNTAVTYSLVSVSDNSGSICPGVVQGSYTVNPEPTASLLGTAGPYCQGTDVPFELELTGIGPWDITMDDGQGGTHTLTANSRTATVPYNPNLAPGNYTFTITQVTDVATGCTGAGSGSIDIEINPTPDAEVGFNLASSPSKTIEICADGNTAMDFQYLSGSGDITVDYEINGAAQPALTVPNGGIATVPFDPAFNPGTRDVVITQVTDNTAAGCVGTGDLATIEVKNLPSVNFSVPPAVCDGDVVTVTYTSNGEGQVSFDVVDDNTGTVYTSISSAAGANQTATFAAPAVGSYTLAIANITDGGATPCNGSNFNTESLDVLPLPGADLTDPLLTFCANEDVLVPFTLDFNGDQTLDLELVGDAATLTPSEQVSTSGDINLGRLAPGNYQLRITTVTENTSGNNCSAPGTGVTDITVNANPSVTSVQFEPSEICEGDNAQFKFELVGNGPWDVSYGDGQGFDTTATVTISNRLYEEAARPFTDTTTYTITAIVDNGSGCDALNLPVSQTLPVKPVPSLQLVNGSTVCEGNNPVISYNATQTGTDFELVLQDQNGTQHGPFFLADPNGTFEFSNIGINDSLHLSGVTVTNSFGCSETPIGSADAITKPNPSVAIGFEPNLEGCFPFTPKAYFTPSSDYDTETDSWNWIFNGNTVSNQDTVRPQMGSRGNVVPVQLSVTTIHGCSDNSSINFTLLDDPVASILVDPLEPTTISPEVTISSNTAQDVVSTDWFIDDVLVSEERTFEYQFANEQGVYDLCLAVENVGGCLDTTCYELPVKGVMQVFVPSGFTPDGDGKNDIFKPVISEPAEGLYKLQIFDRWGKMVFETENPDKGWDGTTAQNADPKPGVYVFKLTVTSQYDLQDVVREQGVITIAK